MKSYSGKKVGSSKARPTSTKKSSMSTRSTTKLRPKKKATSKKSRSKKSSAKKAVTQKKEIQALEKDILKNPPVPSIQEDTAYLDEYMSMFRKLRKMRKMAEQKYMLSRSSRDIYALVAIYSQQREVIADIRASTDLSKHAHIIIDSILQPMMNSMAQELLNSFYAIKQILISNMEEDKTDDAVKVLSSIIKNQASFIQKEYEQAKDKTLEVFNEPL